MTPFLQIIAFAVLAAGFVGWGIWVYDTNRPIDAPEHLREILVHGLAETEAAALAQAIAVGVVGQIAEHKRVVQFVNTAAATRGDKPGIQALVRVSQPAPELIGASAAPEALDITIEFAGSKVATKGLQSMFAKGETRGGLSLSLLLKAGEDGALSGLASASFPGNSAYGFSLNVEGQAREIAEQIAMRFVQAHYAANDSFFAALDPKEFRAIWDARREAAEIALRSVGGAGLDDATLKQEAREVYATIAPLAARYTRRPDLQRLGAYLASVGEQFEAARTHLQAVNAQTQDEAEKASIDTLIAALEADAAAARGTQIAVAAAATAATTAATTGATAEVVTISTQERLILDQPEFRENGLADLAARTRDLPAGRTVTVALVLGGVESFPPFGDRVRPADADDAPVEGAMREHTEQVASLIATLAPRANVVAYRAVGEKGYADIASIVGSLGRALASGADVIALPLGPLQGKLVEQVIADAAGKGALLVAAAGNSGGTAEGAGAGLPGVIYVGASEEDSPAQYSNRGLGVKLYAPGRSIVFDRLGTGEMRGTTVSTAIAAAAAANLKLLSGEALDGPALETRLLDLAKSTRGGMVLDLARAE